MDKIVQGNTSNIVFLKSTDDSMLDTLQKMSGTTHRSFIDSKNITRDMEKIWMKNEGKVSYTMSTKEVPVISYNDMAFITDRNSIIFRAGDPPVWNRNETILPMSWRLFQNTITQPGKDYSLQTIPTLSSALDFDIRQNQPDFMQMLDKRMKQATVAEDAKNAFKNAYGYTDYQIQQLDIDTYSDDIMSVIGTIVRENARRLNPEQFDEGYDEDYEACYDYDEAVFSVDVETNDEINKEVQAQQAEDKARNVKKFANNYLSAEDLNGRGGVNHSFDEDIIKAYVECKGDFYKDVMYFRPGGNGGLMSVSGIPYITGSNVRADINAINQAGQDENSRTYTEGNMSQSDVKMHSGLKVEDAFIKFLAGLDNWHGIAKGRFEKEMARIVESK